MQKNIFLALVIFFISFSFSDAQTFNRKLKLGDVGQDVLELQKILNSSLDTQISESGIGSPGNETNYFGLLTQNAVKRFQLKYKDEILTPNGLLEPNGFVGLSTIKKLENVGFSGTNQQIISTSGFEYGTGFIIYSFVPLTLLPNIPVLIFSNIINEDMRLFVNGELYLKEHYFVTDEKYVYTPKNDFKEGKNYVFLENQGKISNVIEYNVSNTDGIDVFDEDYFKSIKK